MPKTRRATYCEGFTLLELLIVIVIIGVLTGVVLAILNPNKVKNTTQDAVVMTTLSKLTLNTESFISAYGRAPNEYEFINSLDQSKVTQLEGNSCLINGGVTDNECIFVYSGVGLANNCNSSGWTGNPTDNNPCNFRYVSNISNDPTRFRIYVKANGLNGTTFVLDNKSCSQIYKCPPSFNDSADISTCEPFRTIATGSSSSTDPCTIMTDPSSPEVTISPTPTGTPTASPTPTPEPSSTPIPTPSPTPTETPTPTPTPSPTIEFDPSMPQLSIITISLPDGTKGVSYQVQLIGYGGTQPYRWQVDSGSLPQGLSLETNSGVISGTPTTEGTSTLVIRLSDNIGRAKTREFNLTINALPSVNLDTITIKGRIKDKFTGDYLKVIGGLWSGNEAGSVYQLNDRNGNFSITTTTTDIVPGDFQTDYNVYPQGRPAEKGRKVFGMTMKHPTANDSNLDPYPYPYYLTPWIYLTKYADGHITVELDNFDLQPNIIYQVTSPIIDLGEVLIWPQLDENFYSNNKFTLTVNIPEETSRWSHTSRLAADYSGNFGYGVPVNYPLQYILSGYSGTFKSPKFTVNYPSSMDYFEAAEVIFYNGRFKWVQINRKKTNYANSSYPTYIQCSTPTNFFSFRTNWPNFCDLTLTDLGPPVN